jgi:hypothetical protein
LKGECKHLTDGGPVEAPFIVRLHVLIRDTQEILNNCGIVLGDMEKNKSLPCADVTVLNPTVDHI